MTALMFVGVAVAFGLGMYWGVGAAFRVLYYRRKADAEAWKCQPRRWLSPRMEREQILLGSANMTAGSIASGLFCAHVASGGATSLYLDWRARGVAYAVASTVVYFLATDAALYWAHRILHRPALFRAIHRYHHRYTSPNAFTAAAMHPIEFATYQSVMLIPLFFLPVPAVGVVLVLLYQNYVALVDHSGVDTYPWLPWQPPTRFHDDHHVHFHVNYGQNLGVWDRIFGTYRRQGRVYGVEVFGGKGAPEPGARADVPVPYVDYSRKAPRPSATKPVTLGETPRPPVALGETPRPRGLSPEAAKHLDPVS